MPFNTAAWITESRAYPFNVKEAPYVFPGPDEVLIQNAAIAMNPLDYKIQDLDPLPSMPISYPTILGSDLAGTIIEIGENVRGFHVGQKVIGYETSRALISGVCAADLLVLHCICSESLGPISPVLVLTSAFLPGTLPALLLGSQSPVAFRGTLCFQRCL